MKYKVCDKCGEIVTKTGIISSSPTAGKDAGRFARCNSKDCGKLFSINEYERLEMKEML